MWVLICLLIIAAEVDEKLMFDTFSAFGVILQPPKIMRDVESGSSKGFAFINFASFEASDVEKPSKESLNSLRVNIYRLERLCASWLNTGHFSNVPDRLRLL
ncbi:unnamed protein product [Meloidogyne enterolobii]|uniref:Uncharacterized protein n=1 Tax=Meloidogyne enterolobii TaxID=390850 RepID=A0ACB0XK82_MELEN